MINFYLFLAIGFFSILILDRLQQLHDKVRQDHRAAEGKAALKLMRGEIAALFYLTIS